MLLLYLNLIDDEQQRIEFEEIYTTYRKQMILLAKSFLHNDADAEDVVHDVFLRIATKHMKFIQGLHDPEDVRNYLLKATKNTALNELKRKGRSTLSIETLSDSELDNARELSDAAFIELLCAKADYEQIMAMSKAELQKAFREAASFEFAEIPRDDMQIQYEFSAAFEAKMERLLQKEKKFTWRFVNTAAKRAAVAIAVCMVLILTACSVPAIREPIVEFIIEVFDIDMDYTFDDNNSPDIITTEYHLSVIPSGFSKVSEDRIEGYIRVDYEAENGSTLYLMQTTGSTTTTVDTEKTKYKILDIDGREVHFHVREYDNPEDTIMVAVWIENSCFFKVCTHGITDEQTVIEIISNVKPIE